jgi:hypothetical protein
LKPERPKEVAKIVDLLGAGEKLSQRHGTPGSDATKVALDGAGFGTGMLRGGSDYCGSGEQGAVPSDAPEGTAPRSPLPS